MNQIKCPKCGEVFQVEESLYNELLQQVKNDEFEKELHNRIELEKKVLEANTHQQLMIKDNEIKQIKNDSDIKIDKLKSELLGFDEKKNLELSNLKKDKENEILLLKSNIDSLTKELKNKELEVKESLRDSMTKLEFENKDLHNQLNNKDKEFDIEKIRLKEDYNSKLQMKDEEISRLKDFKMRLSTKMVGETLESHCYSEFSQVRNYICPRAYFEKDNKVSNESGSKGDFIFRDYTDDTKQVEFISIMFDMKNENDTTATKKKNVDFLKELDKDRNEKGCEYAILVSMLEPESELYNSGIVDVSNLYPKMYVIRPQFFVPMISILRNAALNTVNIKNQYEEMKRQNIDVTNFENKLNTYRDAFSKNVDLANNKFDKAIKDIDDTIKKLETAKEDLLSCKRNLNSANNKLEDITIRKLTYNNKTMKELFDASKEK